VNQKKSTCDWSVHSGKVDFATVANCDQISVRLRIKDIRQEHPVPRVLNAQNLNLPIRRPGVDQSALVRLRLIRTIKPYTLASGRVLPENFFNRQF
jgi:hypothetical protein